jgi:gliding motility-associated-like protein
MTLSIYRIPTAEAGADAEICEGSTYTVGDASAQNYESIIWSTDGDGALSGGNTLTPTYTPAIGETGSITLTLTANANGNSCPDVSDYKILTITPMAIANAGFDDDICVTGTFTVSTASADNYSSLHWSDNGPGSLSGETTLTPTYDPAPDESGIVILTLTAIGNGSCGNAVDNMVLYVAPLPTAFAGPDGVTCENVSFEIIEADASNYSTFVWSTTGSGEIQNGNTLNPTYVPAPDETGPITLTLTANGQGDCPGISDVMTLQINPAPVANAGEDAATCQNIPYTIHDAFADKYDSLRWVHNGLGTLQNPTSITPTYVPALDELGEVDLSLTVFGHYPCEPEYDNMTLAISSSAIVYAGPDDATCENKNYTLTQAFAENYTSLTWSSSGTGSFDNVTLENPTYTPSSGDILNGHVTLMVYVNALEGCENISDNMVLTFYLLPVANAGDDGEICEDSIYTVNGASALNASEILWTHSGQGTLINETTLSPTYLPAPGETGIITFTMETMNGDCPSSTDQMLLTITEPATASAGPDDFQCGMDPYQLDGTATNYAGVSWSSSGSGSFSDQNIIDPTYTPSEEDVMNGSVTLTLSVDALGSCPVETDQMELSLALQPVANAGNDTTICEGISFTVTNASAAYYASLYWTTDDGLGTILDPLSLTPTYEPYPGEVGTIHLKLMAEAIPPCTDVVDEMTLTISGAPQAVAGSDGLICQGSTFPVSGWAINYKSFWWTTDGVGTIENGTTLEPTYVPAADETGIITLTLNVEGFEGCDTITDEVVLQITHAANAIAGPDAEICEGSSFDINQASASNYAGLEWLTTGTGTLSDIHTLTPSYSPGPGEMGEIMLILVAFGNLPCPEVYDTLNLYIFPAIQATAGGDDAICQGDNYPLINAVVNNYSAVTWSSSGTGTFDDQHAINPTYYPSQDDNENGFVILTATIKGLGPCEDMTVSMRLDILSVPTAAAGMDASICEGESYQVFGASVSNNIGIRWSTSGDGSFNDTTIINPVYTPGYADIATGHANLTLTAVGAGSCGNASADMVLTIILSPDADAGVDQHIDHYTSTELNGSASGGSGSYSYLWSPANLLVDASEQMPTTLIITDTTLYILTVTDKNSSCQGVDSVMVYPGAPNNPPIAVGERDTTYVNVPITVNIEQNDSDPDNDNLTYARCEGPDSGPHNGTVIINGDGTITYTPYEGFVGIDSICYQICDDGIPSYCDQAYAVIVVIPDEDCLRIYNGITPNGDGINDTWVIDCIDMFSENEVFLFNRWGDIVKHLVNYDNKNVFWDGTNKDDEKLPDGTYYFVLKLSMGDLEKVYTGWVFVHGTDY